MLSIFSYVSGPSVCRPWRSVCSSLCPFFNWVVCLSGVESYEFFVYMLEIRPLSEVSLANMFFHMVGSLFILILFSLAEAQTFLSRGEIISQGYTSRFFLCKLEIMIPNRILAFCTFKFLIRNVIQ